MTKKKINIIITVMIVFIVLFLACSFAYENYQIQKSDMEYEESLGDLEKTQDANTSSKTNEEIRK